MHPDQPVGGTADDKQGPRRAVDLVFVSGSSTEYADGVMEEVNDRGIVLSVEEHVGRPARPLFYPWSAVIRLSEKQRG